LIGCILLTKSLSCNVLVFTGTPYIPESSKYLEFIFLRWNEPYYDKFSVTSIKKVISEVLGRFCANSNSEKLDPKISFPCLEFGRYSVSKISTNDLAIPSGHPSVSRSFEQFKFAYVQTSWQHVQTRSSEFQKNPAFKFIRLDDVAIPSGRQSMFNK